MINGSNDFLILHCKTALSWVSVYECVYTRMCISVCDKSAIHSGEVKIYACNYFFFIFFFTAIIYVTNMSPPLLKQYHLQSSFKQESS